MVPKLFGSIRDRYASRPGGYTRVLRIEPMKEDQAESAILELVDGPRDMRFAMTAKTLARLPPSKQLNELTAKNVKRVTQFREDGVNELRDMVERLRLEKKQGIDDRVLPAPRTIYPEEKIKRDMHYPEEVDSWKLPNPLPKRHKKGTKASKKLEVKQTFVKEEQTLGKQVQDQA
jgi:large subunit ribosomal protein L17